MRLSWNEIKSRALTFTNEWKDEVNEHAETKSYWDDKPVDDIFLFDIRAVFSYLLLTAILKRDPTNRN